MWASLQRSLRHGVIMIGLLGCVGLAAADNPGASNSADDAMTDETTGSLGPVPAQRAPHELALSDAQRGRIYDSVMNIPDAPVVHVPAPEVAAALPRSVPMQDLPGGLTRDVPQVQGHKFVKFDDRILVVDPATRLVVAMIPRYKLMD